MGHTCIILINSIIQIWLRGFRLSIKYFLYMRRHFPAFASSGRFPGGPASADFFLNDSSARPISPRSRLLQLQQKNKKKVSLLKNVLIPPFLPFRSYFSSGTSGGKKCSQKILFKAGGQTADDEPQGRAERRGNLCA